ncbi:MAG TPA: DUF5916 domain-containing protein [Polyangia bacterium]|jgi:hypothetical protein|nr:DUF5916 domain-containing protein [Polyangia bacterium]
MLSLSLLPLAWLAAAADPDLAAVPHLNAVRTAQPPVIDGRLDDPAWKTAQASQHFVQNFPSEGQPPSEKTTLRVLYDDEALYVAFDCEQRRSPIAQRLTRRDQDSESDWVQLQLDTRRDGKNAFIFAVNVSGVIADGTLRNQSVISLDWDEVWEARTALTDHGWSAELRLPLRILRFDAHLPVQSWGMQASRIMSSVGEGDQWALIPRSVSDWVARFGRLDDLRDLKRGGTIELRPFVTARAERQDGSAQIQSRGFGLVRPSLRDAPAGLDLKWHLTQGLTLDAAALPEFGQVEADRLILNLTNYETFLPEKRPLFVEGAEYLTTSQEDAAAAAPDTFPNRVFYSRRIGSAPPLPLSLNDGEHLTAAPQPSTIDVAAKLTGQIGSGVSVGALSALTNENRVSSDQRAALVVAPATSFNVLRLRREFGAGHLGLIATGTTRFEVAPDASAAPPPCPDSNTPTSAGRCFHDAYVAGADGLVRFGGGLYSLSGQVIGSRIVDGPERTLADGTLIGPGASGLGSWARVAKEGGAHLVWNLEYAGHSRRVDYNDVGFMARQNLHELKAAVEYRNLTPTDRTREQHLRLDAGSRYSLDGLDLGKRAQLTSTVMFQNFWIVSAGAGFLAARQDDREIGEQGALLPGSRASLERAHAWILHAEVDTDFRRRLVAWTGGDAQLLENGWSIDAWSSLAAHPLPQFDLGLDLNFTDATGEPRFATTECSGSADAPMAPTPMACDPDRQRYVFGRLTAKSAGAILRANYTFTRQLTLQTYAQLFLASGHYTDLRRLPATSGAISLADIAAAPTSTVAQASADFERAAVNISVVLRWEYRLGSTLYLIYARSQLPTVDSLYGPIGDLHLSALRHGGAADVILFKLSYWWAN